MTGVGSTEPSATLVRRATVADEPVLRELWSEFEHEVPPPPEFVETWEKEWADVAADIDGRGIVLLAEEGGRVTGVLRATMKRAQTWHLSLAHVRASARRQGVLETLLGEAVREGEARGARRLSLHVLTSNTVGVAVWKRLGFETDMLYMTAGFDDLTARLDRAPGETFGSIHVQTDDRDAVLQAVDRYRPRIAGPGGTAVGEPRHGWVAVYDEVCERDPTLLQRLARELSYASGSVVVAFTIERETAVGYSIFDRGSSIDDYLSVPEARGPLPPGDFVAFEANPRVVARVTGADPAAVRSVARTAASPAELPPVRELAAQVAALMGIEGADRGYAG